MWVYRVYDFDTMCGSYHVCTTCVGTVAMFTTVIGNHVFVATICFSGFMLKFHPYLESYYCGVCLELYSNYDGWFNCLVCDQGVCHKCSGEIMLQGFISYDTHPMVDLAALIKYVCPFCRAEEGVLINAWDLPRAPIGIHVVPSSLNGNNGEWTNGDDLASKGDKGFRGSDVPARAGRLDDALRQMNVAAQYDSASDRGQSITSDSYQRRARQRRQHQRNPGSGGKCRSGATLASEQPKGGGAKEEARPPEPAVAEDIKVKTSLKVHYVTHYSMPNLGYDGDMFFISSEPCVVGGTQISCVKNEVGHFTVAYDNDVVSDRNKPEYAVPPIELVTIPAYRRMDVSGKWMDIAGASYNVVEPLWRMLNKSYRSPVVSEQIAKAVTVTCSAYNCFRGVAPPFFTRLCEDTGLAFLSKLHHMDSTQTSGAFIRTLVTSNFEAVGVDGGDLYRNLLQATIGLVDLYSPTRVYDVNATMPLDYKVRGDFRLKLHGNVTVDDEGRPVLPSVVEDIRRYRTVFFSFSGHDQAEWCEHAPTAYNLNRGLKRMLGGKANEEIDRLTAISFGAELGMEFLHTNPSTQKMFKKLVNRRVVEGDMHPIDKTSARVFARLLADLVGMGALADRVALKTFNDHIYDPAVNTGKWAYAKVWELKATYLSPWFNRNACAEIIHAKSSFRQRCVAGKEYAEPSDIYVNKLEAKLKREIAKAGKVPKAPRLTVSYAEGCMYANELPEYVKVAINGMHRVKLSAELHATIIIVGKPKDHPLSQRITTLISVVTIPGECCALIYSDDFCIAGCYKGHSFAGNGDISSNDSSQDVPAFLSAWYCMAAIHPEHAEGLINQCMLPIRVVSPEDGADKVDIKFDGPFEGSGTVLTTVLNHLGTTLGCICSLRQFVFDVNNADPKLFGEDIDFGQSLVKGFRQIGHTITWASCMINGQFVPERLQFLKHSPCRTTSGEWVSVLNAGAMLRSLGSVEDDLLPRTIGANKSDFAKMTHDERINRFVGAVVAGHVHEHSTPLLAALRARFTPLGATLISSDEPVWAKEIRKDSVSLEFEPELEERSRGLELDVDSWMRRYGLEAHEVSEMVAAISDVRVGQHYKCTGFAKIYSVDYDVEYLR